MRLISLVFVIAMFLGRIADLYGRKTVLMSSIFGLVAGLVWIMVVCESDSSVRSKRSVC